MSLQYYSVLPDSDVLHRTLWLCLQWFRNLAAWIPLPGTQQEILHPTASAYHSWLLLQLQAFLKWLGGYLTNTTVFHCDPWSRKIKRKKCSKMWWYNCFKFGWVRGFLWAFDRLLSGRMWKWGGGIMVLRAASFFPSCSFFWAEDFSIFIIF